MQSGSSAARRRPTAASGTGSPRSALHDRGGSGRLRSRVLPGARCLRHRDQQLRRLDLLGHLAAADGLLRAAKSGQYRSPGDRHRLRGDLDHRGDDHRRILRGVLPPTFDRARWSGREEPRSRPSGASGRAARPEAARGSAAAPGSTPVARDATSESGAAARSPAGSRSPAAPRARSSRGRRGSRRSACRSRWR